MRSPWGDGSGCIRIDTYGVDAKGTPGRQSVILIRGEYFLWYAGISGTKTGMMVVTTIGLDQAEALVKGTVHPAGGTKARGTLTPGNTGSGAGTGTGRCPADNRYRSAVKKFCPSCGKPLRPNLKFCSSCGAKIT